MKEYRVHFIHVIYIYDLLVGFLNKKILDTVKRVKFVFVEIYSNLELNLGERGSFLKTLEQFVILAGDNLKSFDGSVGLVATKTPPDTDVENIEDYLEAAILHLEDVKKKALRARDTSMQLCLL